MALAGSEGQSSFTMTIQSTGESLLSLVELTSMMYNDKKKEIKWTAGSRIPRIVPKKPGNAGGGKAGT